MNILVLNCGSSSIKFQIVETDLELIKQHDDKQLAKGLIERIGSQALVTIKVEGKSKFKNAIALRDHTAALKYIIDWITSEDASIPGIKSLDDIHAIGHRVAHGGERFKSSTRIDPDVIEGIKDCIDLAPLHNPHNVKGIESARAAFGPAIPQVAVFDTSFHTTMDEATYLYAIPYQYYRRYKIRRYGFHGTSHRYVAYRYRKITEKSREETNIITLHLGNGASACAIKEGKSINTSMGFTPLEGLVMGTRSGDIDPAVVEFLMHKENFSVDDVFTVLNKKSGILGVSGLTNDMRDLEEEELEFNDRRAKLALDMFANRIKKYIGQYLAEMNGADAIIFTAGIGENSANMRKRVLTDMDWLGLELDEERNKEAVAGKESLISNDDSKIKVYVLPTNEELVIARDTVRVVLGAPVI